MQLSKQFYIFIMKFNIIFKQVQCKEESNKLLKNNIDFKEKQLSVFQTEIENSGRLHRKECMELKKKIVELENIV